MELDAGRGRDGLALLDQAEDEMAEIGDLLARREVGVVREPGQRGD